MCLEQDPFSHFERLQMGIFGFSQKDTGAKSSSCSRCHSFVMYIAGAKFEEHCFNNSRVILD